MGFFTVGNIITLGIVLLILILYRQMDRNNRSRNLIRDYTERQKKELGEFVKDQERAVKDYAISLNVERDAAKELMKRLQQTEEELAQKAQSMDRIDSQIKAYESSLAELDRMTGRVQENMNRVRDESAFVEATGKRIGEVKDKLAEIEKGLGNVERKYEQELGDIKRKYEEDLGNIEKRYEQELGDIERKFENENTESLEKAADTVMAGVKSTVSDLRATEETIERKVEEHRLAVTKIEEGRAANLARDTDYINKLLAKIIEQAGKRADKMEEAALARLKEQAEDRINKLKTAEEERLRTYQESAKARVLEVQALVKNIRDEWRTERSDWETKDKAVRDERKKDLEIFAAKFDASKKQIEDFSVRVNDIISSQETLLFKTAEEAKQNLVKNFKEEWRTERSEWETKDKAIRDERKKDLEVFAAKFDASRKQMEDFSVRANEIISSQEALLLKAAEEMKQKALEVNAAKLEEYRRAQDIEFQRLESLADDSRNLDAELRRYMQELIGRLKEEFSGYRSEAEELRKAETENFSSTAAHLKGEMAEIEKELTALKSSFYENISGELKSFENEFFADFTKRNNDMDLRIVEWQNSLEKRLSAIGGNSETALRELEHNRAEEMKKTLAALDAHLASELELLKSKADAFEEGILDQMKAADDSVSSFREQLDHGFEDTKIELQAMINDIREEWRTERSDWESKDKVIGEERRRDLEAVAAKLNASKMQIEDFSAKADEIISSQEALLLKAAEEMKQKALESNAAKLEEYRRAQDIEFQRLESLADDSRKLDAELRRYMQDLIERLKDEFSVYQGEAEKLRKAETEDFSSNVMRLEGEMAEVEKGLAALKSAAHENISGELKSFENEFFADLAKRNDDIDQRIVEWQGGLEKRLSAIGENSETALRKLEHDRAEEMRKTLAAMDAHLASEFEANAAKLEEYRRAQDIEFKRLESLADDSRKLDTELRRYMQELIERLKEEFSGYQRKAEELRQAETENFSSTAARLEGEMTEIEKRLTALKSWFYENISGEIKSFENEFLADLTKRNNDIDQRIVEWQGDLDKRLSVIGENSETALRELERNRAEDMKKNLSILNARLVSDLEHLKSETGAFEEGILGQMKAADDSVSSFRKQLDCGFEDTKVELEAMVGNIREEWRTERSDWEDKDKAIGEERKKDLEAFAAKLDASKKQIEDFSERVNEIVSSQEALLLKAAEEMKQKALEVNAAKLEEYRRAQDIEFKRLEALADDSRKLDAELRRYMQELIGRLKEEFSDYRSEAEELRKAETENFSSTAARLEGEMTDIERDLAALKLATHENVSEELKSFENEFFADLNKRGNDIDAHIMEWQGGLEKRLSVIGENSETALRELEYNRVEDMKKNLSVLDARLVSELERLKSKAGAFEEGILGQMKAADDSVSSFKEQLDRGLEDARQEAEISIKAEIGNYSITAAETVKKYQRELDDAWKGLSARLRELDDNVEDARRRIGDLAAETDNRIASVRSSVEDAERHIREAKEQTKIIDVANAMKLEMERQIEDLRGDIDRLDQRRAEAAKLENEFIKIKRHEDDINAKMIKIFSEERRIENMEANFNRFLQISRSVEEKLADVTASNDTLLGVQLQIRKLEEALGGTEEKYQRLERKNQILDNTNDGIEKNFKILQDTEKLSEKIGGELVKYSDELGKIKVSIEKLSAESEKAANAVDRIDVLNNDLEEIEERIKSMQRARQWIAETETRFEELNRQAQTQAKAIGAMLKGKESGPKEDPGKGASSLQKKENVIALIRQGWSVDEIAKAMKISKGEVELIKDMAPID